MGITWRVIRRVISSEGEGGRGRKGKMVLGSRSIIDRNKIDRGTLRIVYKREKTKNLQA